MASIEGRQRLRKKFGFEEREIEGDILILEDR